MSLRPFFAALEAGITALARADLAKELSPAELDALRAARLVKEAPPFTSWPCDQTSRRCGREVVSAPPKSAKPFVAVCEGSCEHEDRCGDIDLNAADLARASLHPRELAIALRALYTAESGPLPVAAHPASPTSPLRLGEERAPDRTRDVFFTLDTSPASLAAFLDARERAARSTLLLVPTARALAPEMATRHAPGAHIEIEILEDAIAARGGKLARVTKLRLVPRPEPIAPAAVSKPAPPRPQPSATQGDLAAAIGAASWSDIKITAVDGHTLRIQCAKVSIRRTYVDLGFAGENREPIAKWKVVLALCAGHGSFRWKRFGSFTTAKNAVSVVQKLLKAAFGLPDNPIKPYNGALAWQAKFFASSEIADDE